MRQADGDQISQELADSVISGIWETAARTGHFERLMQSATPEVQQEAEAAMDRHAARMRAAGAPGW
jgi:hypothetical protein